MTDRSDRSRAERPLRRGGRATSIRDVARAANVSITTVSHALGGARRVAPATGARVHAAAQALGYRPNRMASALRTQRTQTIGMLISQPRNPQVASYVEGVEGVLGAAGYGLVLAVTHLAPAQEERALALIRALQADAVILAAQSVRLLARVWEIAAEWPVALVNALPPPRPTDVRHAFPVVAAYSDEARASATATRHLLAAGHRRIAVIQRGETLWTTRERIAGYRKALAEAAIPFDPALLLSHEPPESPADDLVRRLLGLPDPPTAAYAAGNLVGMRLFTALQTAGVPVPGRLALVVSADEDWMQMTRPQISAMALPGRELGAAAARLLLARLSAGADTDDAQDDVVAMEVPLVVRESSGPGSAPAARRTGAARAGRTAARPLVELGGPRIGTRAAEAPA